MNHSSGISQQPAALIDGQLAAGGEVQLVEAAPSVRVEHDGRDLSIGKRGDGQHPRIPAVAENEQECARLSGERCLMVAGDGLLGALVAAGSED